MYLILKLVICACFLEYVAPKVNIPAIFQKPKEKIEIPSPKTLDIREATPEEYNCVGRPNGNYVNLKDCKSFWACVKNQTYFVVCPEFPAYQTYYNPVKRLCDNSKEDACLSAVESDEDLGNPGAEETQDSQKATDEDESENKKDEESEEEGQGDRQGEKSGEETDSNEDHETRGNRLEDEL